MQSEVATCFISHLQRYGNLLQVWVQKDHNQAVYIEDCLLKLKTDLQYGGNIPRSIEDLHHGLICAAKFADGSYYRTEIQHPEFSPVNAISALFIDYGNVSLVGLGDVRLFNREEHKTLLETPPLAISHFVVGVGLSEEWKEENVAWIKHQVQYTEPTCTLYYDPSGARLIDIPLDGKGLAETIVESKLGYRVSEAEQLAMAAAEVPGRGPGGAGPRRSRAPAGDFPATATVLHTPWAQGALERLPQGSTHNAYISHVQDGPLSFFVQLKKDADELLPNLIEILKYSIPSPNKKPLLPGSVCLGRCSLDKGLRRGVVMSLSTDSCRVYYTDFGDTEDLPYSEIYQLPPNIAVFPPLALHFGLTGVEANDLTGSAKMVFKDMVLSKEVVIRVNNPASSTPARQHADLLINGRNICDVLPKKDSKLRYSPQSPPRMRDVKVRISFVESVARFFVQYCEDDRLLGEVQDAVGIHCSLHPPSPVPSAPPEVDTPVAAMYDDQTWYRAKVLEVASDQATVLYVDYGNKEFVNWNCTVRLPREIVEMGRALAAECELTGYEMLDVHVGNKTLQALEGEVVTLRLQSIGDKGNLVVDIVTPKGDSLVQLLKPRVISEPQLTVTQDGNRRTVVAGDLSGTSRYETKAEKPERSKKKNLFEPEDKLDKFTGGREKYQNKSYYEHDNRVDDFSGAEDYAKKSRSQFGGERKNNFGREKPPGSWKDGGEDRGWNKPDDKRDGWNKPDDKRDGWNKPNDKRESWNKPDERRDNWNKPDERRDNWNKPDDKREGWNKPEDKRSSWNKPDDKRSSWNRPDDKRDNWNRADDKRDNWNKPDDKRDGWNRSDDKRDGWNRPEGDKRENKWKERDQSDTGRAAGGGFRYNRDSQQQDGVRFKVMERGGGGGERWNREDQRGRWNSSSEDKPKGGGGRWGGGSSGSGGGDDGRKKWNRDEDGGGGRRGNWRGDEERGTKKWNKDKEEPTLDYKRPADDFVQRSKNIQKAVAEKAGETEEGWDDDIKDLPRVNVVPALQLVSEYPRFVIEAGTEMKVRVSHIISPEAFYVQGFMSDEELDTLREVIDSDAKVSFRPVSEKLLCVGTPVLARYSEDTLLYRGVIKQVTSTSSMSVLFVDYGNCQVISTDELFLPTEEMGVSEAQAVRCSLADVRTNVETWSILASRITETYFINFDYLVLRVEEILYVDGELTVSVVLTRPDGLTVSEVLLRDDLVRAVDGKLLPPSNLGNELPMKFLKVSEVPSKVESSNLAKVAPPTNKMAEWNERLELLVGQYLHVQITESVSVGVFKVKLNDCPLEVVCTLDVNQNAEKSIAQRPSAIVEVVQVLTSRLVVRLFNIDGTPMGEATRPMERICPVTKTPVVNSKEKVYVSHSEGNTLYLQKISDSNNINELLENIFVSCENTEPSFGMIWKPGDLCCANSADGNWYRAKISEKDTVQYVDYGNTEIVAEDKLRPLPEQFFTVPELAVKALLPVLPSDSDLSEHLLNGEFDAFFLKRPCDREWSVELHDKTGKNVLTTLEPVGIKEDPESPFLEVNSPVGSRLAVGMKVPVVIAHIDYPSAFWVHLSEHIDTIERLQIEIQTSEVSKEIGPVFAARYAADETWYRATWENVETKQVRFVDYGNVDTVTSTKALPDDLVKPVTGYGIPVFLDVYPKDGVWSAEAYELFEKFIDVVHEEAILEILSVRFKTVVELTIGGKSASQALVDAGFATYKEESLPDKHPESVAPALPVEPRIELPRQTAAREPPSGRVDVFIAHSNSVNDFYVTLLRDNEYLETLGESFTEAENFPSTNTLKESDLIVAQFPDDDLWYRARVLSVKQQVYVQFIDYGNCSVVKHLRKLPPQYETLAPFAIHCSLGIENPTDETENKFMEMYNQGTTQFGMKIDNEGSPNMVTLTLDGENILKSLESNIPAATEVTVDTSLPTLKAPAKAVSKTRNVFVCHSEGPDKFYIHYESDEELINSVADMLIECEQFPDVNEPKVNDILAGKFSDGSWYRAVILSTEPNVEVRFIDYGNSSVVTELKQLPSNISNISPLAKCCTLEKPYPDMMWTAGAKEKFTEMVNEGLTMFEVTFIKEGEPGVVQLVLNGYNIVADLIKYAMDHPSPRDASSGEVKSVPEKEGDEETETGEKEGVVPTGDGMKHVYVCFSEGPNNFYVQEDSVTEALEKMACELQQANEFVSILKPLVNDLVAAKFFEDDSWYRGRVLSVEPTVSVRFIDYGNCADVVEFRVLPADIASIPPMAINCALPQPKLPWTSEAVKMFTRMIDEGTALFGMKTLTDGDPKIVVLTQNGSDVATELLKYGEETEESEKSERSERAVVEDVPEGKKVYVCYSEGPSNFFILEDDKSSRVDEIENLLMEEANSFKIPESILEGDTVAAKFPDDGVWYRALVLTSDPEIRVRFIDYGNSCVVTECRELPESLASEPPLAVHSSLHLPSGTVWTTEAEDKFTEITNRGLISFRLEVVEKGEPQIVDLFVDDQNLREELFKAATISTELNPSVSDITELTEGMDESKVYVSHVVGLKDFYVQRHCAIDRQQDLFLSLAKTENFAPVADPKRGDLVCAQFPDDMQWYRCMLKSPGPEFEALLIDFGSSTVTSHVLELPEELKSIEPLAERCQLSTPKPLAEWSHDAEAKFLEVVAGGSTLMEMQVVDPDTEPKTVTLLVDGRDIRERLEVLSEKSPSGSVRVCHFEGPSDFYTQESCEAHVENITCALLEAEKLDVLPEAVVGSRVCAKNESLWERAVVLQEEPETRVFFLDSGVTSATSDLRRLPEELADIPALAKHCALRKPPTVDAWSHEAQLRFVDFVALGNETGRLELIVIEEGDPAVVDLVHDSKSLFETLSEISVKPLRRSLSYEEQLLPGPPSKDSRLDTPVLD